MKFAKFFTLAFCLLSMPAFCQVPQIFANGVVNAASFGSPVAPGSIVSIFGSNLASGAGSATAPFPPSLRGTSVSIGGYPAPVLFVSPGQVNVQVPAALGAGSTLTPGTLSINGIFLVVTTAAGTSPAVTIGVTNAYPGFFSIDGSGCGSAAALNITPDGVVSINSPSNSAAPGDYIALFGTGFGLAFAQPPDGAAPPDAAPLISQPGLFLNMDTPLKPTYAGLAPSFPGLDQINFQLPAGIRNGCAVPVGTSGLLNSPPLTISVQAGRGQCADPPTQSYGSISFYRSASESPVQESEFFSATFPAGPALTPPSGTGVPQVGAILTPVPLNLRSCPVAGYSDLSAGPITVQPPSGSPVTVPPQSAATDGAFYSMQLPTGFLGAGTYTLSGTPGNQFTLNTALQLGSPITVQTSLASGTAISTSQPLTIQWTGGDASSKVSVALSTVQGTYTSSASATAGSVTVQPPCSAAGVCSFSTIPSSVNIGITVSPASAITATLPGITFPVQMNWQYSYQFNALTLTN
ncbi:MAG TPA: IPT/TIG domain-containing protein [Bryobacteraceae bacterium]|jgi:uncharacterized protein (TIGR03437 family)|nr:IPT/TIG domain-containing protein [Bryobacteraceae bacterium]